MTKDSDIIELLRLGIEISSQKLKPVAKQVNPPPSLRNDTIQTWPKSAANDQHRCSMANPWLSLTYLVALQWLDLARAEGNVAGLLIEKPKWPTRCTSTDLFFENLSFGSWEIAVLDVKRVGCQLPSASR